MKRITVMTALAFCAAASLPAVAADNANKNDKDNRAIHVDRKADTRGKAFDDKLSPDLARTSKIVGTDVVDEKGDKVGDIKEVVLDRTRGTVAYAVMAAGGTLGVGDKYFAIPWTALKTNGDNKFVLNIDRDKLKKAEGFDKDHWPDMASRQWNTDTARYYGQQPYWEDRLSARHGSRSTGHGRAGTVEHGVR